MSYSLNFINLGNFPLIAFDKVSYNSKIVLESAMLLIALESFSFFTFHYKFLNNRFIALIITFTLIVLTLDASSVKWTSLGHIFKKSKNANFSTCFLLFFY